MTYPTIRKTAFKTASAPASTATRPMNPGPSTPFVRRMRQKFTAMIAKTNTDATRSATDHLSTSRTVAAGGVR